jgi:uncharacterized alpha-E superfamily protein
MFAARVDEGTWNYAVRCCRELGLIAAAREPTAALSDDPNPLGLVADVRRLAWCATQVRTRLSVSNWRAVVDMQRRLQDAVAASDEPREVLDQLLLSLAALAGFALDDMRQDQGWRLLRVGKRLERLQFSTWLLAQHLLSDDAARQAHVEWLLDACDSTGVYRSHYSVAPRLGPMLDLLVRDAAHPQALAFQWRAIARDLGELAASLGGGETGLEEGVPQLTDSDIAALENDGPEGREARQALATRLRALGGAAGQLSDRLSLRHFTHISWNAHVMAT